MSTLFHFQFRERTRVWVRARIRVILGYFASLELFFSDRVSYGKPPLVGQMSTPPPHGQLVCVCTHGQYSWLCAPTPSRAAHGRGNFSPQGASEWPRCMRPLADELAVHPLLDSCPRDPLCLTCCYSGPLIPILLLTHSSFPNQPEQEKS